MINRLVCPCGVYFGGNANNSSNDGFVYANSNNTPSNSNANIGSHLCFQENNIYAYGNGNVFPTSIRRTATLPLGKKSLTLNGAGRLPLYGQFEGSN